MYSKSNMILFLTIFMMFKVLGLAPCTMNVLANPQNSLKKQRFICFTSSRMGSIYNIILSLGFFALIIFFFKSTSNDQTSVTIDGLLMMAVFIGRNVANIFIICMYVIRRRKIVSIINRFLRVNTPGLNERGNKFYQIMSTVRLILLIMMYIIAYVILQCTASNNTEILRAIPGFFLGWCMIQYAFVLIQLQKKFQSLNESLELLTNRKIEYGINSIKITNVGGCRINQSLHNMRKTHRELTDIARQVNDFYSVSVLLITICAQIGLLFTGFFQIRSFTSLDKKSPLLGTALAASWLIQAGGPIILLTNSVAGLCRDVSIINNNMCI